MVPDEAGLEKGREGQEEVGGEPTGEAVVKEPDWKAKHDEVLKVAEREKSEREKLQAELTSPDYLNYRAAKLSQREKPEEKQSPLDLGLDEETLAAMTEKDKFELLTTAVEEVIKTEVGGLRKEMQSTVETERRGQQNREVATFAAKHADFQQLQPIIYGIAATKHVNDPYVTIEQIYEEAKEYVKGLGTQKAEEIIQGAPRPKPGESPSTQVPPRQGTVSEKIRDLIRTDDRFTLLRRDLEE